MGKTAILELLAEPVILLHHLGTRVLVVLCPFPLQDLSGFIVCAVCVWSLGLFAWTYSLASVDNGNLVDLLLVPAIRDGGKLFYSKKHVFFAAVFWSCSNYKESTWEFEKISFIKISP